MQVSRGQFNTFICQILVVLTCYILIFVWGSWPEASESGVQKLMVETNCIQHAGMLLCLLLVQAKKSSNKHNINRINLLNSYRYCVYVKVDYKYFSVVLERKKIHLLENVGYSDYTEFYISDLMLLKYLLKSGQNNEQRCLWVVQRMPSTSIEMSILGLTVNSTEDLL